MNSCEYYQELISRMLDDELENQEVKSLAEHLSVCSECAAMYSAFSMLSDFVAEDLEEVPETLSVDIMASIRRAEMVKRSRRNRRPVRNLISAAACVAVVVAAVGGIAVVRSQRSDSAIYESRISRSSASGTNTDGGLVDSTVFAPETTVAVTPVPSNEANTAQAPQVNWESGYNYQSAPAVTEAPMEFAPEATPFIPPFSAENNAPEGPGIIVVDELPSQPDIQVAPEAAIPQASAVVTASPAPTAAPTPVPTVTATEPPVLETPAVFEAPAAEEPAPELPAVTESPAATEAPADTAGAAVAEGPADTETPDAGQTPSVEEAPVQDSPSESFTEADTIPAEPDPYSFSVPVTEHDLSQLDCSELISGLFGLEAGEDAQSDAQEQEEDAQQSEENVQTPKTDAEDTAAQTPETQAPTLPLNFIDRLIYEKKALPIELPEGFVPERVEMLALSQEDMFFVVRVDFVGDELYIISYDSKGQSVCFKSPLKADEYDSLLQACYVLDEAE